MTSFETIHAALCEGLSAKLRSGKFLRCEANNDATSAPDQMLPYLALQSGSVTMDEWDSATTRLYRWDIPGQLKVGGAAGESGAAMRSAFDDLAKACDDIRGLPIDEEGNVVRNSPEARDLERKGKLSYLANRGGPFLRSAQVIAEADGWALAKVLFHIDFIGETETTEKPRVQFVKLGIHPDPDDVPPSADRESEVTLYSALVQPETEIAGIELAYPNARRLDGGDPAKTVVALRVEPHTLALEDTETFQLIVIATMADGATFDVTGGASFGTSDADVATVDSAGLVTAVDPGSATLTATFSGYAGTCSVTVS